MLNYSHQKQENNICIRQFTESPTRFPPIIKEYIYKKRVNLIM